MSSCSFISLASLIPLVDQLEFNILKQSSTSDRRSVGEAHVDNNDQSHISSPSQTTTSVQKAFEEFRLAIENQAVEIPSSSLLQTDAPINQTTDEVSSADDGIAVGDQDVKCADSSPSVVRLEREVSLLSGLLSLRNVKSLQKRIESNTKDDERGLEVSSHIVSQHASQSRLNQNTNNESQKHQMLSIESSATYIDLISEVQLLKTANLLLRAELIHCWRVMKDKFKFILQLLSNTPSNIPKTTKLN